MTAYHGPTRRLAARTGRAPHAPVDRMLHATRELGREASAGQSARTPAILVAGMAVCLWTLAALMIAVALLASRLITG